MNIEKELKKLDPTKFKQGTGNTFLYIFSEEKEE